MQGGESTLSWQLRGLTSVHGWWQFSLGTPECGASQRRATVHNAHSPPEVRIHHHQLAF